MRMQIKLKKKTIFKKNVDQARGEAVVKLRRGLKGESGKNWSFKGVAVKLWHPKRMRKKKSSIHFRIVQ